MGHIAVVNSEGALLYYNGNPEKVIFARSSMKRLQAIPIIETGAASAYQLKAPDVSLACASHGVAFQTVVKIGKLLNEEFEEYTLMNRFFKSHLALIKVEEKVAQVVQETGRGNS